MRRIIIILALFASISMYAEDFKILFVNSESIKIGKAVCKAGDTFNDTERIFWKDGKQAMKVISLETKKQYVLVSEDFKKKKMKTAKDFIFKIDPLKIPTFTKIKQQTNFEFCDSKIINQLSTMGRH